MRAESLLRTDTGQSRGQDQACPAGPAGLGCPPPRTIVIKSPIDRADHPIDSGNYCTGTPALGKEL